MKVESRILMVGPARDLRGDVSVVMDRLQDLLLSNHVHCDRLVTLEHGGAANTVRSALGAIFSAPLLLRETDIVHIHVALRRTSLARESLIFWQAKLARKKVVLHVHTVIAADAPVLIRAYARRLLMVADAVIAVSETHARALRQLAPHAHIRTLLCPVPMANVLVSPKRDEILFVGQVTKEKGIFVLIDAFAKVAKQFPSAHLVIVGEGKDMSQAQHLAARYELDDRVEFRGWLSGAPLEQAYASAKVLCFPSLTDALALEVLAAMARGVPVVASAVDGVRELLSPNKGLVVAAGDAGAFRRALVQLFGDAELQRRLATCARAHVLAAHSPIAIMTQLQGIYDELC